MQRVVANLIIALVCVLGFQKIGWVHLKTQTEMLTAAEIACITVAVGDLLALVFSALLAATMSFAFVLLPLYWMLAGYLKLVAVATLMGHTFSYSDITNQVLLMSWALGCGRLHWGKLEKPKTEAEFHHKY